jgi:hypothetical protein
VRRILLWWQLNCWVHPSLLSRRDGPLQRSVNLRHVLVEDTGGLQWEQVLGAGPWSGAGKAWVVQVTWQGGVTQESGKQSARLGQHAGLPMKLYCLYSVIIYRSSYNMKDGENLDLFHRPKITWELRPYFITHSYIYR